MMDIISEMDKKTILIVDDTPENLTLLSALLKNAYKIKVATRGQKALQIAASSPPPDLILLDVMMPEMDGYETCRLLKQDTLTQSIPVIFLTAKNQEYEEKTGRNLGAVDYLNKPVDPALLLARVAAQFICV